MDVPNDPWTVRPPRPPRAAQPAAAASAASTASTASTVPLPPPAALGSWLDQNGGPQRLATSAAAFLVAGIFAAILLVAFQPPLARTPNTDTPNGRRVVAFVLLIGAAAAAIPTAMWWKCVTTTTSTTTTSTT